MYVQISLILLLKSKEKELNIATDIILSSKTITKLKLLI